MQERINHALPLLENDLEDMRQHSQHPTTLPYLIAVANLRFALSVVAELLYNQHEWQTSQEDQIFTDEANLLVERAKLCCSCTFVNEKEAGPAVYLLKLLARQYGTSFLSNVHKNPDSAWVMPKHLNIEVYMYIHHNNIIII